MLVAQEDTGVARWRRSHGEDDLVASRGDVRVGVVGSVVRKAHLMTTVRVHGVNLRVSRAVARAVENKVEPGLLGIEKTGAE